MQVRRWFLFFGMLWCWRVVPPPAVERQKDEAEHVRRGKKGTPAIAIAPIKNVQ